MRERPIEDLLDALRQLGADATSELGTGCPPVVVRGRGLPGGRATVAGDISSQFLSGLLLAAPYAEPPVEIDRRRRLVSQPYVDMTLAVMAAFGVDGARPSGRRFRDCRAGSAIAACRYAIEPDASAASYFFAAAAITGGERDRRGPSPQQPARRRGLLRLPGADGLPGPLRRADRITVVGGPLRGIEVDMNAISDTVQTLAAVALFADGPDDDPRRRPHPPQGDRPHPRAGHRVAQAGRPRSRSGTTG